MQVGHINLANQDSQCYGSDNMGQPFQVLPRLVKYRLCTVEYESIKQRKLDKLDPSSQGSQSVLLKEIIPVLNTYTFHHT